MAKLVSLKLDPKDAAEEDAAPGAVSGDAPEYPYGSRLNFDGDEVEKLGLGDCEVGETVMIQAKATVISYSEDQRQNGEDECRIGIQITDIAITPDAGADKATKAEARMNELGGTNSRDD